MLQWRVALYPLSSPNHNGEGRSADELSVALYPLSSPNHNGASTYLYTPQLRYILFHHQTTTDLPIWSDTRGCVISSFITKPQPCGYYINRCTVALYPLSSPNHNCTQTSFRTLFVALYPLSSPNHNSVILSSICGAVALYPLSSPNHN